MLWTGRKMFFAIQKANLVEFQSSRFRLICTRYRIGRCEKLELLADVLTTFCVHTENIPSNEGTNVTHVCPIYECITTTRQWPYEQQTKHIWATYYYLPRRRRPGTGDIATPLRPSCLVLHCNSKTHWCIFSKLCRYMHH